MDYSKDSATNSSSDQKTDVKSGTDAGSSEMKLLETYQIYCLAVAQKSESEEQERQALTSVYKAHRNDKENDTAVNFDDIMQYCQQLSEKTLPTIATISDITTKSTQGSSSNQVESSDDVNGNNTQVLSEEAPEDAGKVIMVKSGSRSYTKITTTIRKDIQASPTSAFTPRHKIGDVCDSRASKRLREDPHLQHLKTNGGKAPLIRSSSMPVASIGDDNDDVLTPSHRNIQHRTIYRTGSVSDATKQKLKSVILLKKSAALVRKPSITEQEIRHITNDIDSSQSDEDDDMDDVNCEVKFGSTEAEHQALSLATSTDVPLVLTMTTT